MNLQPGLERCLTFINCQLQPSRAVLAPSRNGAHYRAVTISRQTGSGGHSVAQRLAEHLQAQLDEGSCPWTVFDRNLVQKVLDDHNLPNRLAKFMPEDRISEISDTMDELFGLHPPSWLMVRQISETILHLAELGHVILIGRGANVITRKLDYVFHVRLVASLEKRVRFVQEFDHVNPKEAAEMIRREDLGRSRYLRKYFGQEIENPLLYHLVINTDLVHFDEAARMIAQAMVPRPGKHAAAL